MIVIAIVIKLLFMDKFLIFAIGLIRILSRMVMVVFLFMVVLMITMMFLIMVICRVATENSFGENELGSRHWFRTISTTARQRGLSTAANSWTSRPSFLIFGRFLIPTLILACLQ